jgi:hypothetical protein
VNRPTQIPAEPDPMPMRFGAAGHRTLIVIALVDPRLLGFMHPPDAPEPAFSAFLALRFRKPKALKFSTILP